MLLHRLWAIHDCSDCSDCTDCTDITGCIDCLAVSAITDSIGCIASFECGNVFGRGAAFEPLGAELPPFGIVAEPDGEKGAAVYLVTNLAAECRGDRRDESAQDRAERIEEIIDEMEHRRKELKVEELSFNSFYEYSVQRIPDICDENRISGIDLSTYRYMMKDFYRGGNHEKTLNENMDSSLFDETFIVFEIDAIKDNKELFPIVTIVLMEVFINKMRRLKGTRKMLIIEEAWKALASNNMASYVQYLCAPVQAA